MPKSDPEPITAVWLRNRGDDTIQVLVEIDDVWRIVIDELYASGETEISHIVEARAFQQRPIDHLGSQPEEDR